MQSQSSHEALYLYAEYRSRCDHDLFDFFEDNHIRSIGVYGLGGLGCVFYYMCKKMGIDIKYGFDKKTPFYFDVDVLRFPCEIPTDIDAIVICTIQDYLPEIFYDLIGRTEIPIYSLTQIIVSQIYDKIFFREISDISQNVFFFPHVCLQQIANEVKKPLSPTTQFLLEQPLDIQKSIKNPGYFKEIYDDIDEYSDRYIREVFTQSPTISLNGTDRCIAHSDVRGEYVNIVNNMRLTTNTPDVYLKKAHWFGSCMEQGIGVDDHRTIPSQLQHKLNTSASPLMRQISNYNHAVWGCTSYNPFMYLDTIKYKKDYIDYGDFICLGISLSCSSNFNHPAFISYMNRVFEKHGAKMVYCADTFKKHLDDNLFIDCGHYSHKAMKIIADAAYSTIENVFRKSPMEVDSKPIKHANKIRHKDPSAAKIHNSTLREFLISLGEHRVLVDGEIGSIVMNCNPFTNGHKYLIEQALKSVGFLYVFVVEEDKSYFPFIDRFEMLINGTNKMKNMKILKSGSFVLSAVTFPDYFVKEAKTDVVVDASTDVKLFAEHIAPTLNITKRFAGEEPACNVTRQYNEAMKLILPKYGIDFVVIPRIEEQGQPISASTVRKLLLNDDWEKLEKYVPNTTYTYLKTRFCNFNGANI